MPSFPSGEQGAVILRVLRRAFQKVYRSQHTATKVLCKAADTKRSVQLPQDAQDKKAVEFDKVAVCMSAWVHPNLLPLEERDLFIEQILHS